MRMVDISLSFIDHILGVVIVILIELLLVIHLVLVHLTAVPARVPLLLAGVADISEGSLACNYDVYVTVQTCR